jgi:hypothetical protein
LANADEHLGTRKAGHAAVAALSTILALSIVSPAAAHDSPPAAAAVGSQLSPRLARETSPQSKVVERGGRRFRISIHGDPVTAFETPEGAAAGATVASAPPVPAASPPLSPTWCGTERTSDYTAASLGTGLQIKVIYAYPTDRHNFATYANFIESDVKAAVDRVAAVAGATKTLRFDLGTNCADPLDYVDIESVALAHPASYYQGLSPGNRFDAIKSEVAASIGPQQGVRNFAIFVDGATQAIGTFIVGLGEAPGDERPDPIENYASGGSLIAEVFGSATGSGDFFSGVQSYPGEFILHEITHTLGAVHNSAPHSTGAAHCFDEWDVMCYADGGPHSVLTFPCVSPASPANEAYDCNEDDYLNPAPAPGTYLATNWNLQNSVFLCPLARCQTRNDAPVASLSAPDFAYVGQPVTFTAAGSSDDSGIARYVWNLKACTLKSGIYYCDGCGQFDAALGTSPTLSTTFATEGVYDVGVAVTDADGAFAVWRDQFKQPCKAIFVLPASAPPPGPPPPGPPPPSPSPPHNTTSPPVVQLGFRGAPSNHRCVVPRVKGLSLKRAKRKLARAGCRYRVRGKGRVRSTSPRAGTRTSHTVLVKARRKRS